MAGDKRIVGVAAASLLWLAGLPSLAETPKAKSETPKKDDKAGIDFFEKKIRPVLVQSCYECHSAGAKKLKGGLLLDTRAGIQKGGDSGAAIEAGNAKDSLLIEALRYDGLEMP